MKLRYRLIALVALLLVGVLGSSLLIIQVQVRDEVLQRAQLDVQRARDFLEQTWSERYDNLALIASGLEASPSFRGILNLNDEATLIDSMGQAREGFKVDLLVVSTTSGETLGRTDEKQGDLLADSPLLAQALEGYPAEGAMRLSSGFYQLSIVPLFNSNDYVVGALTVGYRIDQKLAVQLNRRTGTEIVISTSKGIAGHSLGLEDPDQAMHSERYLQATFKDKAQEVSLTVLRDTSAALGFLEETRRSLFLLGLLALATTVVISAPVIGRVINPVELVGTVVKSVADGLCHLDADYRIRLLNPEAEKLLGVREVEVLNQPLDAVARLHRSRRDEQGAVVGHREVDLSRLGNETLRDEDGLVTAVGSGNSFSASFVVAPIFEDGEQAGAVLVFRDITPTKAMQQELRDVSRRAGMAEVATGVLHNVGNTLNSVGVSASLLREKLENSKVESLSKATALLEKEPDELAAYLTQDAKGQKVPLLLRRLAEQLEASRTKMLDDIERLDSGLDHISKIVRLQQAHTKDVRAVSARVDLHQLLDEALALSQAGTEAAEVQVLRKFESGRYAFLDKHVALQILVNLISNGFRAAADGDAEVKRLVLRAYEEEGRVIIEVEDNGVGIPKGNLSKLFEYGFTTREDGHGFGLHNSALGARHLRGELTARSPGEGLGATFTLSFPLQAGGDG